MGARHRMQSITRRVSQSENVSGPSCARSGTLVPWPRPKPPWPSWSLRIVTPRRNLPHGWKRPRLKGSLCLPCPNTIAVACAHPTLWNEVCSKNSSAAQSRSGSSPTRPRWNGWSAQCWSRSTTNGPPTQRPTSNGNVRMHDHPIREFPDNRLLNPFLSC
jgi:hypothetical protein